ncbi:hypothetical protein REPUB_Repub13aG0243800 [Reevesia pubescens]
MGFAAAAKPVLLVQLSLLLLSSFTISAPIWPQALPPHYQDIAPVMAPSHPPSHHHHRHPHPHPHPHPPTPSPTEPPTHPAIYPPPKAPTPPPKPPVHPPTKPPTYAPPKPPVHPPTKPPTQPPTKPPTQPPTKPPTEPPTHPPTKPPTHPPTKPPTKPPTHPPTKPPVHPPTYPPSHPPAKPPTYPKPSRSLVAVQGVVYCKSCKYAGTDTLLGAKPISGATVKLTCRNTIYKLESKATTDKNGYFFLQAPKGVTSFGAHRCTVSLVSSPLAKCSKPSNLHGGVTGATLRPEKPFVANNFSFILYSVGPLAFEPKCY